MNCQHVTYETLIAYVTNDLDKHEAVAVMNHIASCDQCSKARQHLDTLRSLMCTDDSQEPPQRILCQAFSIFTTENPRFSELALRS